MIPIKKIMNLIEKEVEKQILERDKKKYHIGKIILTTNDANPLSYIGFGTWELWGKGRVPVGVDVDDEDFNEVEKEVGEKKHKMTVKELVSHTHNSPKRWSICRRWRKWR